MPSEILADLRLPSRRWRTPILIGLFGLPCSGKSEIARVLASHLPLVILATDAIRLRHRLPSGPATHRVMYETAAILLSRRLGIVWDGLHLGRADRDRFRTVAHDCGARCILIYATASDDVLRRRLAARVANPAETVAAEKFVITPEHFQRIATYLEPPTADEDILSIDTTDGAIDRQLGALVAWAMKLISSEI